MQHPELGEMLNSKEEDCFKHLSWINVHQDSWGYKIDFRFKTNPYFNNTTLTKNVEFGILGKLTSFKRLQVVIIVNVNTLHTNDSWHMQALGILRNLCTRPYMNYTLIGYHESTINTPIEWKISPPIRENNASKKNSKKRQLAMPSFFEWFLDEGDPGDDPISDAIINDLWINPLYYFEKVDNAIKQHQDQDAMLAYMLERCCIPDLISCHWRIVFSLAINLLLFCFRGVYLAHVSISPNINIHANATVCFI